MGYNPFTGTMDSDGAAAGPNTPSTPLPVIDPKSVKNGMVPMLDSSGKPVSVPQSQLENAVKSGYKYESPAEEEKRHAAEKYNYPSLAAVAGAARTASYGASDLAARVLGQQEHLKKLREYNPVASVTGEVAGAVVPAVMSGGASIIPHAVGAVAKKATAGIASKVLASAATAGIEGAAFGAGQLLSEESLGSERGIGEAIMANVGLGAVLGAGTGAAIAGVSKAAPKISKLLSGGEKEAAAAGAAKADTTAVAAAQDAASSAEVRTLTSWEKLANKAEELKYAGDQFTEALPPLERLKEAVGNVGKELHLAPHDGHYEMLSSNSKYDIWRATLETPGLDNSPFFVIQNGMRKELEHKISNTATRLAPGERKALVESGNDIVDDIRKQYETSKAALGKEFNKLKTDEIGAAKYTPDLISSFTQDLSPKATDAASNALRLNAQGAPSRTIARNELGQFQKGKFVVNDYSSTMGLSPQEFGSFKQVINDIQKPDLTVKDLQNVREYLRKSVDAANPENTEFASELRKKILAHIDNVIELERPGSNFRAISQKYAKNEGFADTFETILKGKIDSYDPTKLIKGEHVVKNIFANQNSIVAAREMLGPERFNRIAADYLKSIVDESYDTAKNVYSSAKLARLLKTNETKLTAAIGKEQFQRLVDLNDIKRITVDYPNINPSGTAKTSVIMGAVRAGKRAASLEFGEAAKELFHPLSERIAVRDAVKRLNAGLSGQGIASKAADSTRKKVIEGVSKWASDNKGKLEQGVKYGVIAGGLAMTREMFKKRSEEVAMHAGNPELMADRISESTRGMSVVHPGVHQGMMDLAVRANNLLNETMPKASVNMGPLDKDAYMPSTVEVAKWNRYVRAVDDPLSVIDDLHRGTLTPEAVKALRVVYPEMHSLMTKTAIEKMSSKRVPASYADKTMLSILTGQPMTYTHTPGFVQRMQAAKPKEEPQQAPRGNAGFSETIKAGMTSTQRILSK